MYNLHVLGMLPTKSYLYEIPAISDDSRVNGIRGQSLRILIVRWRCQVVGLGTDERAVPAWLLYLGSSMPIRWMLATPFSRVISTLVTLTASSWRSTVTGTFSDHASHMRQGALAAGNAQRRGRYRLYSWRLVDPTLPAARARWSGVSMTGRVILRPVRAQVFKVAFRGYCLLGIGNATLACHPADRSFGRVPGALLPYHAKYRGIRHRQRGCWGIGACRRPPVGNRTIISPAPASAPSGSQH